MRSSFYVRGSKQWKCVLENRVHRGNGTCDFVMRGVLEAVEVNNNSERADDNMYQE